jgi:hypothetical protein
MAGLAHSSKEATDLPGIEVPALLAAGVPFDHAEELSGELALAGVAECAPELAAAQVPGHPDGDEPVVADAGGELTLAGVARLGVWVTAGRG